MPPCVAENSCAAYHFVPNVMGGDLDPCNDGIQLTSHTDDSCNVKCVAGYSQGGSPSVSCASDASSGEAVTTDITCAGEWALAGTARHTGTIAY